MNTPALVVGLTLLGGGIRAAEPLDPEGSPLVRRVYSHWLEPREHPDYERRAVKPPDWSTFKHRTQFTVLRGFNVENDRIVGYAEEIEKFTRTHELGDVIWPSYPILFAKNLGDLADEIARRDLYLFDVWGYVPGSGPGGYWQQFQPPKEAFATLEAKLGDRWLGTDIGEQDGRYLGGYANQMTPASADRFEQYLNFQRHFERMGDDLGHRHATLVSLNFGHYFLKEGTYTLIGAETAQALPNSQVYYAFIRGAGKQHGVPWFGNASIYNRWGYKTYGSSGKGDGHEFGPTKGSSLSLLKRLLYSHLLYNSVAAGFENMWFDGDQLSPIGRIQQAAQRWVKEHGSPGVQHTPVALMLDFNSGWSFPRHLYTDKLHRVWGNLPYGPGDHLTDGLLDLIYPGYADASYFRDETGFLTATPFGDLADVVLTDAPLWVLERYPLLIVAGELGGGRETQDKLLRYAAGGGHLVFLQGCWPIAAGERGPEPATSFKEGGPRAIDLTHGTVIEQDPSFHRLENVANGTVLARCGGERIVVEHRHGRGRITQFASPHGIAPTGPRALNREDTPLRNPRPLQNHVRSIVADLLRGQQLFAVDPQLHLITCRQAPGKYTLGVFNHTWREQPLRIASRCGSITSIRELPLDESEKGAVGYTPEGVDPSTLGRNSETTIAGGDVRVFAVTVEESGLAEIAHVAPPSRPRGRLLPVRRPGSLKEAILARPTFFEHFDGVTVDWRYLRERERAALALEAGWLKRQGVRVAVDLSSGVNLYPDLRLIDNLPADHAASTNAIVEVLEKMEILGARDLLFSLHRHPETNFTDAQTREAFEQTLQRLAAEGALRDITLHLRQTFGKPPWNLPEAAQLLDRVAAPNLKLAPSLALLQADGITATAIADTLRGRVGFWLISTARRDLSGDLWDAHAPWNQASDVERRSLADWLRLAPEAALVLDAVLPTHDEEYLESIALARSLPGRK